MLQELSSQNEYKSSITEVKSKIRSTQMKAIIAVNSALIHFYWELGKMIAEKVEASNWGDKILEQVSIDLKAEFPDMKGLSLSNLKYCKLFFNHFSIRPQAGDENPNMLTPNDQENHHQLDPLITRIPWGHIKLIINKVKNKKETFFYISKTIENGWSRDTLAIQIKSSLYERQGKAINNFKNTLPKLLFKGEDDKPTIGIILFRDKNNVEAEFALRDINKPMGVSEFDLTTILPNELKSSLPTIEEIETTLLENN